MPTTDGAGIGWLSIQCRGGHHGRQAWPMDPRPLGSIRGDADPGVGGAMSIVKIKI